MAADPALVAKILEAVPQKPPFRFIDTILEIDGNSVVGEYRYRPEEYFYAGHFPGNPITPGVILIETMAQVSVVAFGVYQVLQEGKPESINRMTTLFSMVENIEFLQPVYPGEKVIVRGEKVYFRRSSLKVNVTMEKEDGTAVCRGTLMGVGVKN
ncbi:MAG: hotdog domain-containing protein [Syntrophaceae bacterium]